MHVSIVGSGTLLPDDRHRSPGHLVEGERGSVLLDCGSGVMHGLQRDGLDWGAIDVVAISHFHTDHIGDLAALLWAWTHGRPHASGHRRVLIGPRGLDHVLDGLASAFGEFVHTPGGELEVVELENGGRWRDPEIGIAIRAHGARHTPEAIAFRIEASGLSLGYTGDTGPHPPLATFFESVDLLISECSVPDDSDVELHLSPTEVGRLARDASAARVVVTHMYPSIDRTTLADRIRATGYSGEIRIASDGMRITI